MEDQYRLDETAVAEVDRLDDALFAAIEAGDQTAFSSALHSLLAYVRAHGAKIPDDEIVPSDVILPSEDMTVEDARAIMDKAATNPAAQAQP
jgi:predicted transcriptional regulator